MWTTLKLISTLIPLLQIASCKNTTIRVQRLPRTSSSCRPTPCPKQCLCYCDTYDSVIIDCSNRDLTRIPDDIPPKVFRLFLNGNNFTSLAFDEPLESPAVHVKHLYLTKSQIHNIPDGWLSKNFRHVYKFRLEQNELSTISSGMFKLLKNSSIDFSEKPFKNLKKLHLSHNLISRIDHDAFTNMPNLEMICVNDNQLVNPLIWLWLPPTVKTLYAANNSYQCDCKYWEEFKRHLMTDASFRSLAVVKRNILQDGVIIRCRRRASHNQSYLFSEYYNEFCVNDPRVKKITIISGTVVGFLLLVIVILGITFRYSLYLRVWTYSKFGVRFYRENAEDASKPFDAFVSYCAGDAEFVAQDLEPYLSNYRLCIHDRHFPAGAFITDTIVRAVDKSCRTIIILSPDSIQSEFCSFEFKLAHYKQLKDRSCRLVIIKIGDITLESINKEILYYLQTHTYLTWGEKNFWPKLYYSLPDPGRKQKLGDADFTPLLGSIDDIWNATENSSSIH